jgi:hypothetical protein
MGRTNKDSARNKGREIVVRLAGDSFDVLLSGKLEYTQISERTLNDVLCKRWGYCGPEFDEILNEVRSAGQKTIVPPFATVDIIQERAPKA